MMSGRIVGLYEGGIGETPWSAWLYGVMDASFSVGVKFANNLDVKSPWYFLYPLILSSCARVKG